MCDVQGDRTRGSRYSEIQSIMGNGHMGTPLDRQTDTNENKLRLRAVNIFKSKILEDHQIIRYCSLNPQVLHATPQLTG